MIFRRDRDHDLIGRNTGGGVLLATSHGLEAVTYNLPAMNNLVPLIDFVICKTVSASTAIYFVLLYVPPDISFDEYELFFDALSLHLIDKPLIILGDFNCPKFSTDLLNADRKSLALQNFMNTLQLKQHNNTINSHSRILDLVFSNIHGNISVSHDSDPLLPEDPYSSPYNCSIAYGPSIC